MNTIKEFNDYIESLVNEYDSEQYEYFGDYCHEVADNSEDVIYYSKAWDLVSLIRLNNYSLFEDAELAVNDMGTDTFKTLDELMQLYAYEIIYQQVSLGIQENR